MFNIGQKVYHRKIKAIILDKWWDKESKYRYLISHSGFTWSVSGSELKKVRSYALKNESELTT